MSNDGIIFVFGSNIKGWHGAGAAREAFLYHDAIYELGFGPSGHSYAIPTKDEYLRSLPLGRIEDYVKQFIEYASNHQDLIFMVTRVGCGLAGYDDSEIAPMFKGAPDNCRLPLGWRDLINA